MSLLKWLYVIATPAYVSLTASHWSRVLLDAHMYTDIPSRELR